DQACLWEVVLGGQVLGDPGVADRGQPGLLQVTAGAAAGLAGVVVNRVHAGEAVVVDDGRGCGVRDQRDRVGRREVLAVPGAAEDGQVGFPQVPVPVNGVHAGVPVVDDRDRG